MKYMGALILIIFAVLEMSCASKPRSVTAPPVEAGLPGMELLPELEPAEPFERAIWNIKKNTGLFKKYIEGDADDVSANGIADAEEISVRGECLIDGKQFRVTYELAEAVKTEGFFRIPFFLENLTDGVSRSDDLFWNPSMDEAGLLLSFDDNYWHNWYQLFDVFDRYGAKAAFFIQGSLTGDDAAIIAEFCKEVLDRGHDLGFHTVNHYNLLNVSQSTFNKEAIEGVESFSKAGISFSAFAFPFGLSQPWMRETLASVFPLTRGYGRNIRFYHFGTINSGYIVSTAVDNIIYPDDQKFEDDIRLILLAAKFTGNSFVPLTSHEFSETAQWGIKPSRLEFLLETAQELRLRFYTYREIRGLF